MSNGSGWQNAFAETSEPIGREGEKMKLGEARRKQVDETSQLDTTFVWFGFSTLNRAALAVVVRSLDSLGTKTLKVCVSVAGNEPPTAFNCLRSIRYGHSTRESFAI